tara:strand:+ start:1810 stop:4032 length:2223 start_codon:yes stop_codon:yes gene_type:complete
MNLFLIGRAITILAIFGTLVACTEQKQVSEESDSMQSEEIKMQLPTTRVGLEVDTHWGVEVRDPYRWMEDEEDPEVREWFEQQGHYAEQVLDTLPIREEILSRLTVLDQGAAFTTFAVSRLANGDVFYERRNAGENMAKLYWQPKGSDEAIKLLDPEALGDSDDQHFSLEVYRPSWNGRYVAYGLAQGGSEETTYYVLDLESGETMADTLTNIETAYNRPQWGLENEGFFYSRRRDLPQGAPETEIYKETQVRYHKVGSDSLKDPIIAAFKLSDKLPLLDTDFPSIEITPRSDHAVLKVKHGDNNEISLFTAPNDSLLSGNIPWKRICEETDMVTDYSVIGDEIFLITSRSAPRYRLVATSLLSPDLKNAREVLPAGDLVVENIALAADGLYLNVKENGVGKVMRVTPDEKPEMLLTPRGGAAYLSAISPDVGGVLVYETTWIQGGIRYAFDPITGDFTDTGMIPRGKFDNLKGYVAEEVLVTSHDGVQVPLSILRRADLEMNGSNPAIVYGYGSYGSSVDVSFSPIRMGWLERGGVFAIAHVRGGGEYGQEWHYAGRMASKPNTWKDLIAAANYLVEKGYTSPKHMAPMGGSAGGILAGRSLTERPDLFGAAVLQVGMLDAIRAETTTNGVPNVKEFGTVTEKDGFEGLLAMSSYHHVKDDVTYPATLLTHGFNDPRVDPWMSGKMAARLQSANKGEPPVLLRVDFDAGHGIGSTREQLLSQYADIYAFLLWQLAKPAK